MARYFDDLMLGSIELFCLTAERQSFTAAAAAAGLTPAAVSRSISRLEARLAVQLFVRTTRRVRLSDAGLKYYEQCRQALGQLVEAEREITGKQSLATGTVRISLPTSYGHYRVLPLLPLFREKYPLVALDIQLSNRNVDFSAEGFDLAVRSRTPPDSSLVVRKLEDADLLVVASPEYVMRHGKPNSLEQIDSHECVQFLLPSSGQVVPWLLREQGRVFEFLPKGSVRCLDDILAPITLAIAAAGLVQTYRFLVAHHLAQGSLIELLPEFSGASRPFSLVYPSKRHLPQRVRVLIDFLLLHLGK
jgi:DNA-binding transcriptional LysR family regulator